MASVYVNILFFLKTLSIKNEIFFQSIERNVKKEYKDTKWR